MVFWYSVSTHLETEKKSMTWCPWIQKRQMVLPVGWLAQQIDTSQPHHNHLINLCVYVIHESLLFPSFDLLELHHCLQHIWCIWFHCHSWGGINSIFFSKSLSTVVMMILQSFSQLLEAVEQCETLTRDVNWCLLLLSTVVILSARKARQGNPSPFCLAFDCTHEWQCRHERHPPNSTFLLFHLYKHILDEKNEGRKKIFKGTRQSPRQDILD